jgi:hypothetical protein
VDGVGASRTEGADLTARPEFVERPSSGATVLRAWPLVGTAREAPVETPVVWRLAPLVVVRTGVFVPVEGTARRPDCDVVVGAARRGLGTKVDGRRARRVPVICAFEPWSRPRGNAERATATRPTLREENSADGTTVQASASPEE